MDEQIINNYHKICENMMEYITENTAADYSLGDLQFRGRLKFDLIRFLHKIINDLPILTMFGGSRMTYVLNEDEHNVESVKQKKFLPNNIYDIDSSKRNIVIIGGSINGLYMSILLKLCIPKLNVIIVFIFIAIIT